MTERQELQNFLSKYQATGGFSLPDLKRVYHLLSKRVHPDVSGNDSELFIRLQVAYEEARNRQQWAAGAPGVEILSGLGYSSAIPAQAAFYVLIQQYFQRGVYRKKVYLNRNIYRKNRLLIDAIQYWGGVYDGAFAQIFIGFRNRLNGLLPLGNDTQYFIWAQRVTARGILACTRYHGEGRNAHRIIAGDRFATAEYFLGKIRDYRLPVHETRAIMQFFRQEAEKDACIFRDYQGYWGDLQIM